MRRILASLLLVLFSFSLIAPALSAAATDSKLPACCRRDGKHHCGQTSNSSGLNAARCAQFPQISLIPAPTAIPAGLKASTQIALEAKQSAAQQIESHSRTTRIQANQKRGPPAFFS